jgi:hypothetical protein
VYLDDGAIRPHQLTRDGRHRTSEDDRAWHLLILDRGRVTACMWYLEHEDARSIEELRVVSCPLVAAGGEAQAARKAIDAELTRARRHQLRYVELGGWAVAREHRHTGEGLLLALAAYGLGRAVGGALGLTTATVRHASSAILRRLGGSSLEIDGTAVPSYYDDRYGCEMELLRFDSRHPNPKYRPLIDELERRLESAPVLASQQQLPPVGFSLQLIAAPGGAAA